MRLMNPKLLVALAAFFGIGSAALFAQDGWELIQQNQYQEARAHFERVLDKDSLDKPALVGMLYLAEVEQSLPEVIRYSNRLQRIEPDWHMDELYPGAVKTDEYPKVTWPATRANLTVRRLRNEGKILAAADTLEKYFDDYPWYYAGPFEVESQSGLSKVFDPEVVPFDQGQLFVYGSNDSCRWRTIDKLGRPRVGLDLEEPSKGIYYFAQAITVDREMDMQFRLGIMGGCRLWVDDSLALSVSEIQMPEPDKHTVTVHLWPGTHRVLLKLASGALFSTSGREYRMEETPLELDWWMPSALNVDSDVEDLLEKPDRKTAAMLRYDFCWRITDSQGNLLRALDFTSPAGPLGKSEVRSVKTHLLSEVHETALGAGEDQGHRHYMMIKSLLAEGERLRAESLAWQWSKAKPTSAFHAYLLALSMHANGKRQLALQTLEKANTASTPFFAAEQQEEESYYMDSEARKKHKATYQRLDSLFPGNTAVIIAYYDLTAESSKSVAASYAKEKLRRYPELKSMLKYAAEGKRVTESMRDELRKEEEAREKARSREIQARVRLIEKNIYADWPSDSAKPLTDDFKVFYRKELGVDPLAKFTDLQLLHFYGVLAKVWYSYPEYQYQYARQAWSLDRKEEAIRVMERYGRTFIMEKTQRTELARWYRKVGQQEKADSLLLTFHSGKSAAGSSYSFPDSIDDNLGWDQLYDTLSAQFADQKPQRNSGYDVPFCGFHFVLDRYHSLSLKQVVWVRILSRAGVDFWTNVDPEMLEGGLEEIQIYKADGKVVKQEPKYGRTVLPNLVVGDWICFQTDGSMSPHIDELDGAVNLIEKLDVLGPISRMEINVWYPEEDMPLIRFQNCSPEQTTDSSSSWRCLRSVLTNLPEPNEQPGAIWQLADNRTFTISTIKDWSTMISWYHTLTADKLSTDYALDELLDSLVKPEMSREQTIEALYNYVTDEISYTMDQYLQLPHEPKPAWLTHAEAVGDCKDVATLLITLLRKSGIDAWYVLVSTQQSFYNIDVPSYWFNHAIVAYDDNGQVSYLDPTADYFSWKVLPPSDNESNALVIRPGNNQLGRLPSDLCDPVKSGSSVTLSATLSSTGRLTMEGDVVMRGVTCGEHRGIQVMESEARFKEEETSWLNFQPHLGAVIDSITQVKGLELNEDFSYHFGARARALLLDVDGVWVMQLPLPQIHTLVPELEDGTIRFGADLRSFFPVSPLHSVLHLTLPPDLLVHSLPAPVSVSSPFGKYELKMTATPEGVQIERSLHFSHFIIQQSELPEFMEFHNKVISADQTILKFKKKK